MNTRHMLIALTLIGLALLIASPILRIAQATPTSQPSPLLYVHVEVNIQSFDAWYSTSQDKSYGKVVYGVFISGRFPAYVYIRKYLDSTKEKLAEKVRVLDPGYYQSLSDTLEIGGANLIGKVIRVEIDVIEPPDAEDFAMEWDTVDVRP